MPLVERPTGRRWALGRWVVWVLLGARVHRTALKVKNTTLTWANLLTALRAAGTTALMLVAITERSSTLLLIGLSASWLLDMADGMVARATKRETVNGAQLDILADRLTSMWVVLGLVVIHDASGLAVAAAGAVWVQLCLFDQLLANQFLRFGHWSPDEFHLEHVLAWYLNWAPVAKLLGNLPLALFALSSGLWPLVIVLSALLIAVRIVTFLWINDRTEGMPTLAGYYDPVRDEVWLQNESPGRRGAHCGHNERGDVVGVLISDAHKKIPKEMLALLPRKAGEGQVARRTVPSESAPPRVEELVPAGTASASR